MRMTVSFVFVLTILTLISIVQLNAKPAAKPSKTVLAAVMKPGQNPVPELCQFSVVGGRVEWIAGISGGGKTEIWHSSGSLGKFQFVHTKFFDKSGLGWVMIAEERFLITPDGKKLGPYLFQNEPLGVKTPAGYKWMVIVKTGQAEHLLTSETVYGPYDFIAKPMFNSTGTKWRCIVVKDKKKYMLVSGKLMPLGESGMAEIYSETPGAPELFFSPDWEKWGYVMNGSGGKTAVFGDGSKAGPFVDMTLPVYSPDGKNRVYAYKNNGGWTIETVGKNATNLQCSEAPLLGYYQAGNKTVEWAIAGDDKKYVLIDGVRFGPYASAGEFYGGHSQWGITIETLKGNTVHILNGKEYGPYVTAGQPMFSPKSWAFSVHAPDLKEYVVFPGGKQEGPYKKVVSYGFAEGTDNWYIVYRKADDRYMIKTWGGDEWGPYSSFTKAEMSMGGNRLFYIADGSLIVDGKVIQTGAINFSIIAMKNKSLLVWLCRENDKIFYKEMKIGG
ncbi:MAG: hypothetical protein A2Y33_10045 [Spirochaetes bacterium GWF1_51_8]|nr:MAG: hypothetical protein A2Y33_10045 [Spirochaetes bacterium GWF1_51_8]